MEYILYVDTGCLRLTGYSGYCFILIWREHCSTAKQSLFNSVTLKLHLVLLNISYTQGRHCSTYSWLFCLHIGSTDAYNWYEPSTIRCTWSHYATEGWRQGISCACISAGALLCEYLQRFGYSIRVRSVADCLVTLTDCTVPCITKSLEVHKLDFF